MARATGKVNEPLNHGPGLRGNTTDFKLDKNQMLASGDLVCYDKYTNMSGGQGVN